MDCRFCKNTALAPFINFVNADGSLELLHLCSRHARMGGTGQSFSDAHEGDEACRDMIQACKENLRVMFRER